MAGTDRSKEIIFAPTPAIILCEPQLGENIGAAARAMANFGLWDLRLVNPRDGWPNEKAIASASKADHVIERVQVFDTVRSCGGRPVAGLCHHRPKARHGQDRLRS